ncbi:hypothetical protein NRS6094_04339 [Bacillus subtilis]|uniref:hypothetical protein n=1 Tax=Bacillus subtilis TaxID=1423 RepID=UPI001B97C6E2|nr:hypothetical protein [Bacillus subtilis]CAF1778163.1 hypothetical protein NRS6094_04339 [Bacillus subtilis]
MGIRIEKHGMVRTPDIGGMQINIVFTGKQNSDEALMELYRKIKELVEIEDYKSH